MKRIPLVGGVWGDSEIDSLLNLAAEQEMRGEYEAAADAYGLAAEMMVISKEYEKAMATIPHLKRLSETAGKPLPAAEAYTLIIELDVLIETRKTDEAYAKRDL